MDLAEAIALFGPIRTHIATTDLNAEFGVYLNPDDLPEVTQIMGIGIERHALVDPGTAIVFNRKRLNEPVIFPAL